MRILAFSAAAGLALAWALSPTSGQASELKTNPAVKAPTIIAKPKPAPVAKEGETCGDHGTSIQFVSTPKEAAKQAEKDEKLVFILHVSGEFEDPGLTWNNAEALRVNALANPEVGKFLNEHFASSFQKVATFRIVNGQKQGGNVASYFCATDGRVLHVVAGPVDAATLLREAKWVVETTKKCIAENEKSGKQFKVLFREEHVKRLKQEYGVQVDAVTFDYDPHAQGALSYRDPSGQPLAPVLPPPPVEGPNVTLGDENVRQLQAGNAKAEKAAQDLGLAPIVDRRGRSWNLGNQGRVHMLMAAHSMQDIEKVYGSVFEGILGEKISNKPVEVVTPFPWHRAKGQQIER